MKTKQLCFPISALSTRLRLYSTLWVLLFSLVSLSISFLFLSNAHAQDDPQMGLPEGAKYRIGKGTLHGGIAYSLDGTRIAVASSIGVWIYDAHTGEELALFTGHVEPVLSVAFSPDGEILASGAGRKWNWWREDSEIRLWDANTGEHLTTLTRPPEIAQGAEIGQLEVWELVFSPDGKTLASASSDGSVRLWDIETGQYRSILEGGPFIPSVAFSPDGKTLVGGSWDNTIQLWDVATGKHRATLEGHMDRVSSVAFSPDGKTLVSGGWDKTVLLWNIDTLSARDVLTGHTPIVTSVAFSPDGKTFASAGFDQKIRLWEADTGKLRATLWKHTDSINTVVFSPDGLPSPV